jgi:Type II secretion system protein C
MEPVRRSTEFPRRLALLLGLAVLLAGVVVWDQRPQWNAGTVPREGVDAPSAAAATKGIAGVVEPSTSEQNGAHPLASLDLDRLHDTIRRPLFEKTRRPVKPKPAAPAKAPPATVPRPQADRNALTLLGVITSESGSAIALFRRNPTGQNVRLQEGDTVDGWTIERIEPDRVLLKQGDAKLALELFSRR